MIAVSAIVTRGRRMQQLFSCPKHPNARGFCFPHRLDLCCPCYLGGVQRQDLMVLPLCSGNALLRPWCPQRDQEQWLVSLKWVMPKDETISFAAKS